MTQEALRMALEALEDRASLMKWQKARDAVKEALTKEKTLQALHNENERLGLYKDAYAQPEQEPVAWVVYSSAENDIVWADKGKLLKQNTPLYTTPPQRTWVGLTDEEIDDLWESTASYYNTHDFARAIEAKLKEKNT